MILRIPRYGPNTPIRRYLDVLHGRLRRQFIRVPNVKQRRGTLTGTTLTLNHQINNGHKRVIHAQVWYSNGSGTMLPMTVTSITSTQILASGGVSGRTYRAVLFFNDGLDTNWT